MRDPWVRWVPGCPAVRLSAFQPQLLWGRTAQRAQGVSPPTPEHLLSGSLGEGVLCSLVKMESEIQRSNLTKASGAGRGGGACPGPRARTRQEPGHKPTERPQRRAFPFRLCLPALGLRAGPSTLPLPTGPGWAPTEAFPFRLEFRVCRERRRGCGLFGPGGAAIQDLRPAGWRCPA